jgi:hypothetical protein
MSFTLFFPCEVFPTNASSILSIPGNWLEQIQEKARRQDRSLAEGDTIVIVSQKVTLPQTMSLRYRLVILADAIEANGVSISTKGTDGSATGQGGTAGYGISLFARNLTVNNLSIDTRGGNGVDGAEGSPGTEAEEDYDPERKPPRIKIPAIPATPGSPGGNAGDGGDVLIRYALGSVTSLQLATVGVAGKGGAGGKGTGGGGVDGPDAPPGRDGRAKPGAQLVEQFSASEIFSKFAQEHSDVSSEAADYLARLAEYHLRNIGGDQNQDEIRQALILSQMSLAIQSTNPRAKNIENLANNNSNIYGVSRYETVWPATWRLYDEQVNLYRGPLISLSGWLIDYTRDRAENAQTLNSVRAQLGATKQLLSAAEADNQAVSSALTQANADFKKATDELEKIRAEIEDRRAELESSVNIGGIVVTALYAAGVIGLVVSAVTTGGATVPALVSLAAAAPDVASLAFNVDGEPIPAGAEEILKDAKGFKEIIDRFDADNTTFDKLIKALKKLDANGAESKVTESGLASLSGNIKTGVSILASAATLLPKFIKLGNIISQIGNADADPKIKALLVRLATQARTAAEAANRKTQLQFNIVAATARLSASETTVVFLKNFAKDTQTTTEYLSQKYPELIQAVQNSWDVVGRWAFMAVRAGELSLLEDKSSEINYLWGYIHPDIVENGRPEEQANAYRLNTISALLPPSDSLQQYISIARQSTSVWTSVDTTFDDSSLAVLRATKPSATNVPTLTFNVPLDLLRK